MTIPSVPSKTTPLPNLPTADVDFETFYRVRVGKKDTCREVSASSQSYWHYTHDPEFYAYRVSIATTDGIRWVGDPKDAPWELIRNHIWVSRNSPFDRSVYARLQEDGVAPQWLPPYWGNSANLAAWCRHPRSLAGSMKAAYGIELDKTVRADMNNVHFRDLDGEGKARLDKYAMDDADSDLRYWVDHIAQWPDHERRLADLYDERSLRGLYADKAGLEKDIPILKKVIEVALSKIPWLGEYVALSSVGATKECEKHGIPAPVNFKNGSEELMAWEHEYGEKYTFVGAMRDIRRANMVLKRYEMILERVMPNGCFQISLSYMGTMTGRSSGTDRADDERESMNMLNMPRDPMFVRADFSLASSKAEIKRITEFIAKQGRLPDDITYAVDVRKKVLPRPGYKFVICDKSQIEARVVNWIAHEDAVLELVRQGYSVYEAHAMGYLGYIAVPDPKRPGKTLPLKKHNAQLYNFSKARELALGFQAGHVQFIRMAPLYIDEAAFDEIFYKPYTPEQEMAYMQYLKTTKQMVYIHQFRTGTEKLRQARIVAWEAVEDYRKKKRKLKKLWENCHENLIACIGGNHEVELPSGRMLYYFDVGMYEDEDSHGKKSLMARTEIGGKLRHVYGGKIVANATSATARDIFLEDQLRADDHGIWVPLDVYDEIVTEVPLDFDPKFVEALMSVSPSWAQTLPIGAEAEESFYYKK